MTTTSEPLHTDAAHAIAAHLRALADAAPDDEYGTYTATALRWEADLAASQTSLTAALPTTSRACDTDPVLAYLDAYADGLGGGPYEHSLGETIRAAAQQLRRTSPAA